MPNQPSIYIGLVLVDPSVEWKLRMRRNGLTGDEVRAAVQWPAVSLDARWQDHAEHGRRLLLLAESDRGLLKVILQPVDITDGTWRLRTAMLAGSQTSLR